MNKLGGATHATSNADSGSEVSLLEVLDTPQVNCLNEENGHTFKNILTTKKLNTSDAFLLSDVDEQLLLNIPVRWTCITRRASGSGLTSL